MTGNEQQFLNLNAKTNALDYLETATGFLERADDFRWKWIAIAIHHALYAFCVLALNRGNPDWVIGKRIGDDEGRFSRSGKEAKWSKSRIVKLDNGPAYRIAWEETDEEPRAKETPSDDFAWTKGKLINFFTALARIQDERLMADFVARPVSVTDDDMKAIQWFALHVRNELIHFVPKSWSIEIEGIRHGCLASLCVIESLVFESNTLRMIEDEELTRIREAITGLREELGSR